MSRSAWATPVVTIPLRVAHAIAEIRETYGDTVDIMSKAKKVLKFGRNSSVGTSFETVWSLGGDETYVTTNVIDTISSSSGSDTVDITIEGHTVSGTGADSQFTFVIETVTLTGQTKATLSTPLARVSRAYVVGSSALVGDVYVYEDSAITAGVPNDLTKAHIEIVGSNGLTQSEKAATTFSNTDYYIMTQFNAGTAKQGSNAAVEAEIQIRTPGGVFRPVSEISLNSQSGGQWVDLDPCVIVPKNADVRLVAEATASSEVEGGFNGYIAQILRTNSQ